MAALGKIRNHGVLLLIVIGVALIIFIVTDFVNNGSTYFRERKANVGVIDGDKVKSIDFFTAVNRMNDFYKIERGDNITSEMSEQINQEVWNQIVVQRLLEIDSECIGMEVSKKELTDMTIGKNPSQLIATRQMFQNPETGAFDPNRVVKFIKDLDNPQVAKQIGQEQYMMMKNYWSFLESNVKTSALYNKYNTLLSKSLVVNSKEASYTYNNSKNMVDVVYAMKPYFTIADSTISIDDSEIKKLYKNKKEQFKQKPSVDISVIAIPLEPSKEDIADVRLQVESAMRGLEVAEDQFLIDSVNLNSDIPFMDEFLTKNDIYPSMQDFAMTASPGDVFGPIYEDNTFRVAKMFDVKYAADSIRLSRILLQNATQEKIDSILDLSKTTPFEVLVDKYTEDRSSVRNGGDMGWVREIDLSRSNDKALLDKVNNANINEPFVYKVNDLTVIFVIKEKTAPVKKVKLALIERLVSPSSNTQSRLFQEAKSFATEVSNSEEFTSLAKDKAYRIMPANNIDRNAPRLLNMAGTRKIIRWAFESEANAVSDVFECDNQLIVATVTRKNDTEYKTMEEVKPQLLSELRKDKKFEQMKSIFDGKSISQLGEAGLSVDTVRGLSFATNVSGSMHNDAVMISRAPYMEIGKLSAPMKGAMGAFVFEVLSKTENPEPYDKDKVVSELENKTSGIVYSVIEALKKAYDVKDERYRSY